MDRDDDASFARIRLTGHGPILYRSIATRSVAQRKWKRCRAATECDDRHRQRSRPGTRRAQQRGPRTGVLNDAHQARSTPRTQNRRAQRRAPRTAEPACSTTSRTRRFARAAERRAAPVPDVACARRRIAFATGCRHPSFNDWRLTGPSVDRPVVGRQALHCEWGTHRRFPSRIINCP